MRRHISGILTFIFIISGIALAGYPTLSNLVARYHHSSVNQQYDETIAGLDPEIRKAELARAEEYNKMLTGSNIDDPFIPDSGYVIPEDYLEILDIGGAIGYVEIPKINESLPIYHGVSEDVLKRGIGHLSATAFPVGGTNNHTVLTGHRGMPAAKMFSDMDKMEIGDIFFIHVLEEILAYQVDQIKIVKPDDTTDLRPVEDKDYVTLLTCHPYGVNSHRMLVRGIRTEWSEEESTEEEKVSRIGSIISYIIVSVVSMGIGAAVTCAVQGKKH